MEEKVKDKKNMTLIFSIMIVVLVLIVGISYAFWQITKIQEETNVIASGCFDVSLEGNNPINLANSYPITSAEGMATTPYTFTITNTCNNSANYIVNLESLSNTTFNNTSIRVALDNSNKLYSEYIESNKYYEDSKEARSLISGTLEANGSITYNLRMWLDEDAPATEQNKVFASKIVVTTGQVELIKTLADEVEIGDYITMTPTATSYTPPGELTGCMNDENCTQNTLNPSELNLWRVIRKNDDGTVDMVSDKVSSARVKFYGLAGYMNLVGGLNTIAAQYTDGKHVQSTRHIGYSNQTEILTDTSAISKTTTPWRAYTSNSTQWSDCDESKYLCGADEDKGAGDLGYLIDYNLVSSVYGTMEAKNVKTNTKSWYWLASRQYGYRTSNLWSFGCRDVLGDGTLYGEQDLYSNSSSGDPAFPEEESQSDYVRPIVTINTNVKITSGDGKSESTAYTFE